MNLENQIKHYLPYNLKCEILDYKSDYVGDKYETIKGYYLLNNKAYFNFKSGRDYAGKNITQFKPILRPMNEVENYFEDLYGRLEHQDVTDYFDADYLDEHDSLTVEEIEDKPIVHLPYGTLQVLLKHHFDVFDLIRVGMAIDINDVSLAEC